MPRHEGAGVGPGESEKQLEGRLVAAKETLGLLGLEVNTIEEGSVAIQRRPGTREVDSLALQLNDSGAIRQLAEDWSAGVFVVLVGRAIPEQLWLGSRVIDVHHEGPCPVTVLVILVQEGSARSLGPENAAEALLASRHLHSRSCKGCFLQHDFVACRDIDLPIAVVERLRPNQCCRLGRAPFEVARPGG